MITEEKYLEITNYIAEAIKDSKFEKHVFTVGGCCRDFAMGRGKCKDIDICVDINNGGIELVKFLKEKGYVSGKIVIYERYGTAMFKFDKFNDIEIESVMTRKEKYDGKSRNPITEFAPLLEDAKRRDFTINTIYHNVSTNKIIDPTGLAFTDIKNKIIRLTNTDPIKQDNNPFCEDPLRILRCIRFSCRYGYEIEYNTAMLIDKFSYRLKDISSERIRNEFSDILCSKYALNGVKLIHDHDLNRFIIKEIDDLFCLPQNKYHFGSAYAHTLKALEECVKYQEENNITDDILLVRMATLLHDIGKSKTMTIDYGGNVHFYKHELYGKVMADEILKRLKFDKKFINEVKFLIEHHMYTKKWGNDCEIVKDKRIRKLQFICKTRERFNNLMQVIHADNMAHARDYCMPNQIPNLIKRSDEMVQNGTDMFGYTLPVNGSDVIRIKNIEPSKKVKECLENIQKMAFSKPDITREECLNNIKNYKFKD